MFAGVLVVVTVVVVVVVVVGAAAVAAAAITGGVAKAPAGALGGRTRAGGVRCSTEIPRRTATLVSCDFLFCFGSLVWAVLAVLLCW